MPYKLKRQPFFSATHNSWVIPLTKGAVTLVDKETVTKVGHYNWAGRFSKGHWSAETQIGTSPNRTTLYLHREVMGTPNDEVDHIESYAPELKLIDNRKTNLRPCTHAENSRNRKHRLNFSGFKGVCYRRDSRRWRASIMKDYKIFRIGHFHSALEAALAYDEAAIRLHGEFATTNKSLGRLP